MGLCLGSEVTEEGKKAKIHSSQIDRDLYEYAKREMNVVKILMLGKMVPSRCVFIYLLLLVEITWVLMFTWTCLYVRNLILGTLVYL